MTAMIFTVTLMIPLVSLRSMIVLLMVAHLMSSEELVELELEAIVRRGAPSQGFLSKPKWSA